MNRLRKQQKKVILSPAFRMETETQAIQRKLEELKKSLNNKEKITKKKFQKNSEKRFSRYLESKKSEKKRIILDRKKSGKKIKLRGRTDLTLSNKLKPRPKKIMRTGGFGFKESKMHLKKKILKLKKINSKVSLRSSNQTERSIEGENITLSTASSRSRVNQRYVALDDSIEDYKEKIKRFNTFEDDEHDILKQSFKSQENNFNRDLDQSDVSMLQEKQQDEDVNKFLRKNGLGKFYTVFIENGFTEFEILKDIEERHLELMKIPKGFRIKLLKGLKKYENNKRKKLKINENKKKIEIKEKQPKEKIVNNFLEKEPSKEKKIVRFSSGTKTEEEKLKKKTTSTSSQGVQPELRKACYNCYKVIEGQNFKSEFSGKRNFCTNKCMKLFLLNNSVICNNSECNIVTNRLDCTYMGKGLYCKVECAEKDNEGIFSKIGFDDKIERIYEEKADQEQVDESWNGCNDDVDLDFGDIF